MLDTLSLTNCEVSLDRRLLCLKHGKYRTFDGTCNNLCNITTGAAFTPHRRFVPSGYDGDNFEPRQFSSLGTRFPLPNTRQVSKKVFASAEIQGNFTHIVMTFGQFLAHDVSLTAESTNPTDCGVSEYPCPSLSEKPDCIGVNITSGNNLLGDPDARCTPLIRSKRDENGNQVSCYR